jgi:hypothetical protein
MLLRLLPVSALLLGGVLVAGAADPVEIAPESIYRLQTEDATKIIRESLKDEVRARARAKAETAAVMLAAFAQQGLAGKDGPKRAAVRDAALEIAEKIRKKDYAAALKQLDTLPALSADPKAKRELVKLEAKIDYKDVMAQFNPRTKYGLAIEERFDELGRSPDETVPAGQLGEPLLLDAFRSAVAAELLRGHEPKSEAKEWRALVETMRRQSLELAAAVQAKDGKATYRAVNQLNRTCDKCHQAFRKD